MLTWCMTIPHDKLIKKPIKCAWNNVANCLKVTGLRIILQNKENKIFANDKGLVYKKEGD